MRLVVDMKLVGLDADDQQLLQNMMLESSAGVVLSQPCQLLLCAGAKQVERTTFDAINSNSLVYDGRLVVDTKFCTNDKSARPPARSSPSRRYRSKLSWHRLWARVWREARRSAASCARPALGQPSLDGGVRRCRSPSRPRWWRRHAWAPPPRTVGGADGGLRDVRQGAPACQFRPRARLRRFGAILLLGEPRQPPDPHPHPIPRFTRSPDP